ncbi:MAG: hypothetical protein O3A63_06115 [Proteobacteria bacterium]|nr:hypothetical protein [Pseudomonadota bacterium]
MDILIDRCAGLDVHKKTVVASARTPGTGRIRSKEIKTFATTVAGLVELNDWLVEGELYPPARDS